MRKIYYIVVHCSATRCDRSFDTEHLLQEHLRRGFNGIGYHYYIRRDGTIVNTRPIEQAGAHAKGFNAHSIGLCYEGGLDSHGHPADTRTPAQRMALRSLVEHLMRKYNYDVRICGHRDLSPDLNGNGTVEPEEWTKLCPCFDVNKEL